MNVRNGVPTSKKRSWHAWTHAVVLVLLVLVAVVARWRMEPVPVADQSSTDRFSATQAKQVLSFILGDQRPHPVDSAANDDVRKRIVVVLQQAGYVAQVQDTTSCRKVGLYTCARIRNIIAVRKGTADGKPILISAHYDSVPAGPGASDDGTGVAVLLEMARLLKTRSADRNPVIFLFTEGEEAGLLGAQAFADNDPRIRDLALTINLEARGTSGQSAMFETGPRSSWLVDRYASTSRRPLTSSLLNVIYKLMPNDTDFSVFKARGVPGLNFAFGEHYAYYHTPNDNLQAVDDGSLQQQGDNMYGLLQSVLDAKLPASLSEGGRVYTDVLGFGVVLWPESWSIWIALSSLLVFGFAAWRWRQQDIFTAGSVLRGAASALISVVIGGATSYLLTYALNMMGGHGVPWHSDDWVNRLLLWSVVLLVVVAVQRLICRGAQQAGLWIGVIGAWLLLGLFAAAMLPGVCYLFILPSAVSTLALVVALFTSHREARLVALILSSSAIVFLVILPVVYLAEIMLGFNTVPGVVGMGVLLGLAFSVMAPVAVQATAYKVQQRTHYAVAALALCCAVVSLHATTYSKTQPQKINLSYLQNGADAMLLAGDSGNRPSAEVQRAMGKTTSLRKAYPWTDKTFYATPVATLGIAPATLTVLDQHVTAEGREVIVRIDASGAVKNIGLLIPEQSGLRSMIMDGHVMDYADGSSKIDHYQALVCEGESCNGKTVTFVLAEKSPAKIFVLEASEYPNAFAGITHVRNEYASSVNEGDQSLVISEAEL